MCMVIDDECLQTPLGTSAEALEQETRYFRDETVRYVKRGRSSTNMTISQGG